MNIFQSKTEFIEVGNKREADKLKQLLRFPLSDFRGNATEIITLYEEVEKNLFEVPRYTHTMFETKRDRLAIERDEFTTNKVKYPPFLLKLREEQMKAVNQYMRHDDDNIIVVAPGSGKTILSLYIASLLRQKAIILVHRSAFFNVWKSDIAKAFNIPESKVGTIQGNKLQIGDQFTIAMFQTLHSRPNLDVYDEFGLVISDECLTGDTLITMRDNTKKPIREIENGDEVLGGTVSNKFMKVAYGTLTIHAGGQKVETSSRHPLLKVEIVQSNGGTTYHYELKRVMSKDLKVGDLLAVRASRKFSLLNLFRKRKQHVMFRGQEAYRLAPITKIEACGRNKLVYDFTTTSHTFVANGILTSNCHHLGAETYASVISRFSAKHMLGLTGTFERTDKLHPIINLFMGRIAYQNQDADLNHIEVAHIYKVDTNVNIRLRSGEHQHSLYHKLLINKDRFLLFLELFKRSKKKCRKQLIFTHSVTYAKLYCALLNVLGYKVMLSTGGDAKRNEKAKKLILEGKLDAIIATVQYLKEGESIPSLDCVHFLTPISNKTDWIQCIGRVQRTYPNKPKVIAFDYVDNLLPRCIRYYWDRVNWSSKANSHKYFNKSLTSDMLETIL